MPIGQLDDSIYSGSLLWRPTGYLGYTNYIEVAYGILASTAYLVTIDATRCLPITMNIPLEKNLRQSIIDFETQYQDVDSTNILDFMQLVYQHWKHEIRGLSKSMLFSTTDIQQHPKFKTGDLIVASCNYLFWIAKTGSQSTSIEHRTFICHTICSILGIDYGGCCERWRSCCCYVAMFVNYLISGNGGYLGTVPPRFLDSYIVPDGLVRCYC